MAKPKGINQKAKWRAHSIRIARYADRVQSVYDTLNREVANAVVRSGYDGSVSFRFADYPLTKKKIEEVQAAFVRDLRSLIYSGTSEEWKQSNLVQDLLADKVLKFYGSKSGGRKHKVYYQTNSDALKAFQERKDKGMDLSRNLWNQSKEYKQEMEFAISSAIEKGTSAVTLSKRLSKYLADFPSLKADYKEKYGKAVTCHDCEYRSIRLARSEINMAYRKAEQERWKQFDFVLGYEVKTTQNGHHVSDICDDLAGKYPKDFVFLGWHPNCMCYVIPVLKSEEQFFNEEDANEVNNFPDGFCKWIDKNAKRVTEAYEKKTLPYWLKDNADIKDCALLIGKAHEAESTLDKIAGGVASIYDASVSPMNIKTFKSLYRKISNPNELVGIDDVKDVLRCTIVSDGKHIEDIIESLKEREGFYRYKLQNTSFGYTGHIVNFRMPNGMIAEVQVNTAEMIYAKETPSTAKRIIGEDKWEAIRKKTGVEGGLGHEYYKQGRELDIVKQGKELKMLEKKSQSYYAHFK